MAVQKGLLEFSSLLRGKTIALFCDNVTTITCLRRSGGTRSQVLFLKAREILLWVESITITLLPQFIQGSLNTSGSSQSARPGDRVGMDAAPGGSPRSSPPVAGDHRPIRDLADSKAPTVLCSSVGAQGNRDRCISLAFGHLQAYAFPPIAIIRRVLLELRASHNFDLTLIAPFWPQRDWFSRSTGTSIRRSNSTTQTSRSAATTAFPSVSRKSPFDSSHCGATLKRFTSQAGFSETVAGQLALCRRKSTRLNYQARWGKFRQWCRDFHHRSSEPTIPKIAEFIKKAAVSTIKGYRAMLSSVFKFFLPEISSSPILKDLVRSFETSAPRPLHHSPPWDFGQGTGVLVRAPF